MHNQPTAAELLDAWRDVVQAAELAERLTAIAADTAEDADQRAVASPELAVLVDQAATAATHAATSATAVAAQAAELAQMLRETDKAAAATGLPAGDALHEAQPPGEESPPSD